MGIPSLSAQLWSCSTAAARKVSAAARRTREPCFCSRWPSLAAEVVFPVPLTPTTRMTSGFPSGGAGRDGAVAGKAWRRTSRVASTRFSASSPLLSLSWSAMFMARRMPMSAVTRSASSSSQSIREPRENLVKSFLKNPAMVQGSGYAGRSVFEMPASTPLTKRGDSAEEKRSARRMASEMTMGAARSLR